MLAVQSYSEQVALWPRSGRHILASFDDRTIVVYQAYNQTIARHALEHQQFGGDFSFSRMSWVKPNFLWMMYRSGWGTKENQQITLGLRLRRAFFDSMLACAVPSTWERRAFESEKDWSNAVLHSSVRVQWDPDHDPAGAKVDGRAIQLGLRGDVLQAFGKSELVEVIDLSPFVAEQRVQVTSGNLKALVTPQERVYRADDDAIAARLGIVSA